MFMHCITKEGREKMRDLNIITVSGTVNREPTYKENKENQIRRFYIIVWKSTQEEIIIQTKKKRS